MPKLFFLILVMIVTDFTSHTRMMMRVMKETVVITMATILIGHHLGESKEKWSRNIGIQNKL